MIYKNFQDLQLSALGMGCMRLPVIDGDDTKINEAVTQEMVDYAFAHGVNYYDTAWGYHGEQSELIMGRCLKKLPREKFYLATKFPGYDPHNWNKVEKIFERQLEKLQVEYFDFYLVHNVCEMNIDAYLNDEKYGIYSYLVEQKRNGRIRHLGFSAHGSREVMERFLKAYGKDMEFCQIQLNWIDYDFQEAKGKVELCKEWNIPVWVMEPLRGGKLCNLPDPQHQRLEALRPGVTDTEWAFRFLQAIPEVTVTLSGMSDFTQMKENVATYETENPVNEEEWQALMTCAKEMTSQGTVPCTACHYCTSHCPMGLDIPGLLSLYNEHAFTGGGFIAPMVLACTPQDKRPSACIACRSCETVCPQQIKISETMADFSAKLGN